MSEIRDWLIWSGRHRQWWRPNERGYTSRPSGAGWYTRAEVERIEAASRPRGSERSVGVQVLPPAP
jgi:hypothetical protein